MTVVTPPSLPSYRQPTAPELFPFYPDNPDSPDTDSKNNGLRCQGDKTNPDKNPVTLTQRILTLETQIMVTKTSKTTQKPGTGPVDDGPHEPCPKCGGRNFWRPSMTTAAWRCRQCVPPLPTIRTDGVFLPPATTKGQRNVRS